MSKSIVWSEEKKKSAIDIILNCIIEDGKSLRSILDNADRNILPSNVTFCEWLKNDNELAKQYARACEIRAEKIFEEIIEIADDASQDAIYTERGPVENKEFVNRSRLKVDARKWVLSKMNPTKYGDKTILSGDKENPIEIITGMEIK